MTRQLRTEDLMDLKSSSYGTKVEHVQILMFFCVRYFNPIRTGGTLRFLEYNSETTKEFFLKPCDFSSKYIGDVLKPKLER